MIGAVVADTSPALAEPSADPPQTSSDTSTTVDVHAPPRPPSYAARIQATGTRDDQPVHDLPQSITVLDRRFIDDVGARRTDDVLPFVPGVQLFSGYGGTWDDYTVRGFRVWAGTTYRNGYLNGYSGSNATDTVNVERIEVVRGPASALYGPGLPGGSINFVTKRPSTERQLTFRLSAGSFSTFRGEIDAAGPVNSKIAYRATASADSTAGYRDFNTFRRWLANPVVEIALDEDTKMLVEVQGFQSSYRPDPLGVPKVGGDFFALPIERSYIEPATPIARIEGALARVEVNHKLSRAWSLRVATQDKVGHYTERTLLWGPPAADGRTLERGLLSWLQDSGEVAFQAALRGVLETKPISHAIMIGVDASRERVAYRVAATDPTESPLPIDLFAPRYGTPLPGVPLPSSPNVWTYGVAGLYANDVMTLLPQLKVMAGARVDSFGQVSATDTVHDRSSEVAVSPRLGAVVDVLRGVSAYANVSKGFWPSLGVTATGNVLRPEHSFSTEAGVRVVLPQDVVTLDLAAFRIDNKNFAVADPDNPNFQHNIGEALSSGFEAFSTARISKLARSLVSYSYTDARIADDPKNPAQIGEPLPLTAKHSGGIWWQFELPIVRERKAGLGLGGLYTSERSLPDQTRIPGYFRVDTVLSYVVPYARASLRIENLLGTRYVRSGLNESALLYGAPRSALFTLQVKL